mmetsp:Transcript_4636/g.10900  ORF Transcript_4636/g.10900 Transcript_4636/m.10900 type:complete len:101 (+) Transcript_4636:155-457(+)
MTVIFPRAIMSSIAACTTDSEPESNADVASSKSNTFGFRTRARAIAIRCFWPPLSCVPRSPTWVWYWSGKLIINSCALASLAASNISSSLGASLPSMSIP